MKQLRYDICKIEHLKNDPYRPDGVVCCIGLKFCPKPSNMNTGCFDLYCFGTDK